MKVLLIPATLNDVTGYGVKINYFIRIINSLIQEDNGIELSILELNDYSISKHMNIEYDLTVSIINPDEMFRLLKQHPGLFKILKQSKKNILNAVYESSPLPPHWKTIFGLDIIHEIMTQSKFMISEISKLTDKHIWYYPVPIDIEMYPERTDFDESVFRVLSVGQYQPRKNQLDAVIAFARTLGNNDDCEFNVKYNNLPGMYLDPEREILQAIMLNNPKCKNIYTIPTSIPREDLISLYAKSSLLLFPSKGEGFGVPPVEAMAVDMPVAYTNWSSMVEVCGIDGNYPIDYELDELINMNPYIVTNGINWARPKISSIMAQLEKAYHTWKTDRKSYYKPMRDIIKSKYSVEAVTPLIKEMIYGQKSTV